MARRKYRRKGQRLSIWETLDWSMNPDTTREIVAVILILLGIIALLGMINAAGSFGRFIFQVSINLWGILGYCIPFIFLGYGVALLWTSRFQVKPVSAVGTFFALIFWPAVLSPLGGSIGAGIRHLFESFLGLYASLILVFALAVVSLLVAFNTSIKALWQRLGPQSLDPGVRVNEPKASVFTTLGRRAQPVSPYQQQLPAVGQEHWEYPSLDLLEQNSSKATSGNIVKNVEIIQKTLKDFGIDVAMGDVNIGPTVTQYTLKPAPAVKLNQITARTNDLALALAAHPIRIEAPIPQKAAVGIEIPNKVPALVTLREVLESDDFKKSKSNLSVALGRDVAGNPFVVDIKNMPHILIAGATGSGKSVCINAMILSLIYQNSPNDLRLILVDPKRVEFTHYNGIPHLMAPVVFDVDKTISALRWTVAEMDRRFKLFQETGRRNIEAYNASPPDGKLPYLVVFIDELADLMAQAANEVEAAIVRLAQMARATGIHLVVATQRPSVDVITGLIKANITNRIAFAVASQVDSRTILDLAGAERLLGNGDMLYIGNELGKPKRVQGVMVTDKEVDKVTEFLKREGQANYDESVLTYRSGSERGISGELAAEDELYEQAKETVVMAGKGSASLLQRRLRVGYARAARLLDMLEQEGVIGPPEGAKPRDVLIDPITLDHERAQAHTPMNKDFQKRYTHDNPGYGGTPQSIKEPQVSSEPQYGPAPSGPTYQPPQEPNHKNNDQYIQGDQDR
ncbi:MAG: putative cell division FtsK/SpoIIIE [Candidatus Berkelbacteria bacterium]|nr:putative cell division FtsK/SpoIIIE [Candidatus Berkelbacteria bacterium]